MNHFIVPFLFSLLFSWMIALNGAKIWRFLFRKVQAFQTPSRLILQQLTELILQQTLDATKAIPLIRPYKFYTELVETLRQGQARFGHSIVEALRIVRSQVQKDLAMEGRLILLKRQAAGQFVGMSLITWVLLLSMLEQVSDHKMMLLLLLSWQLLGLMVFIFYWRYGQQQCLGPYVIPLQVITRYQLISQVELSQQEKISYSKVDSWRGQQQSLGRSHYFHRQLFEFFDQLLASERQWGVSVEAECRLLLEELWGHWELDLERLALQMQKSKTLVAIVFFLSSFLFVIYWQASQFLFQL